MRQTNPTPQPSKASFGASAASGNAGARAHFAKMKAQVSQLKGAGAFTGGLATGMMHSRTKNSAGKFKAKGKA